MAEAKQKGSQQAARKRRKGTATKSKSQSAAARSRSRSSNAPRSRSRPKSQSQSRPKSQSKPAEVTEVVEAKAKEAGEKAKDAGKSVGRAAKKARVPLLAGGAVIAGAAGGAALASRQAHHHRHNGLARAVRKIDSDDVAKAARRVGDVSARVGRFAADFQRARESSNGSGNGRHRSPVEVVLQGLTARR